MTSCRSTKQIAHTRDTVYIAQKLYDSVFVDRQCTTITSHDTVFIDRLKTEYRYRLRTDTMHLFHTDTVVRTTYKEVPTESRETLPWITLGMMVLVVGVVVVWFWNLPEIESVLSRKGVPNVLKTPL